MNRDEILKFCAAPLAIERVEIPEWGGSVTVREMSAGQRDAFDVDHARTKGAHFRARLAVYCTSNGDGSPLFTEADIPILSRGPARPLDRIAEAALRLNKFTEADLKELEKNSERGPSDGS